MNTLLASAPLSSTAMARAAVDPAVIALSRAIKRAWLAHIAEGPVTAEQHAVYALLRGQSLDKTFTSLRRPSKIQGQNGIADATRRQAERLARGLTASAWAPFAPLLEGVPVNAFGYVRQAHPLLDRVAP